MNRISHVLMSARDGIGCFDLPHSGDHSSAVALATVEGEIPEHVFLRYDSDSMEPTVPRNSLVVVHVGVRPEDGGSGVYVFRYDHGGLLIRRVHMISGWSAQFLCDNPRYRSETLSCTRLGEIPCLGRVVSAGIS